MRRWLLVVALVTFAAVGGAQQAKVVPPEILDRIVDDDPNPLPRDMTPAERMLPPPLVDPEAPLTPPPGPVTTPAEYQSNDGLLMRWGSFNALITAMTVGVTTADETSTAWILVSSSSQQASASSTLSLAGADMDQVEFILYSSNTVWIRDYGPRFIRDDVDRAIVDHTYNRPRPLDDAFPDHLQGLWGEPQYDLPLVHGGGNFHLFGNGDAFMTDLILDENPGLSEQTVVDLFAQYEGVDLEIVPGFPSWFDSTRHIDMWMLPVREHEVIIGEYAPSDGLPHTITETVASDLATRGYTVHRTPGWRSGAHYTYTNSVVLNEVVFVCEFGGYPAQNAAAVATYETAFADRQVIPVDCSDIIFSAGAVHCIVMHVPRVDPVLFADGFTSGDTTAWSTSVP